VLCQRSVQTILDLRIKGVGTADQSECPVNGMKGTPSPTKNQKKSQRHMVKLAFTDSTMLNGHKFRANIQIPEHRK